MIPNDIKAVADQLVQLENMVPLLKEASAQMGLMRKKVKFLEAGATDIMGPPSLHRNKVSPGPIVARRTCPWTSASKSVTSFGTASRNR